MDACPFCGGQVDKHIVMYGGSCPHCFADIPGEEAATDPGENVKKQLAQEDKKRASRRTLLPLLLAAPVVLALVGVAAWLALRPEPELAVLDLDEGAWYTPDLDQLVVANVPDGPKADAVEAGNGSVGNTPAQAGKVADRGVGSAEPVAGSPEGTRPSIEIKRPNMSGGSDDSALLTDLTAAKVDDTPRGVRVATGDKGVSTDLNLNVSAGVSTSGLASGGVVDMGAISQELPALSNPQQIAEMVQGTLRKRLPALRVCYENSLRATPNLAGKWTLTFTVETDGRVSSPAATGQEMADGSFEECLVRRISEWRFQKIVKPLPVKKTVDFTR